MPKKPKPEPKAVERERPYEMISPEPDGEERVGACCAQKRGRCREPGFRMSEEHRTKIQNSRIPRVLIDHIEGREEISQARVTAALARGAARPWGLPLVSKPRATRNIS
jgi:hypothetical protein